MKNENEIEFTDRMVKHPSHYAAGKYECIDVLTDLLSRKIDILKESSYYWASAFKYLWRVGEKHSDSMDIKSDKEKAVQDISKAIVYLNWTLDFLSERPLRK